MDSTAFSNEPPDTIFEYMSGEKASMESIQITGASPFSLAPYFCSIDFILEASSLETKVPSDSIRTERFLFFNTHST